jgi:hypothetical protein
MPGVLPNHVLKLMEPADRKALGKAGVTAEEAIAKAEARSERQSQRTFSNWLSLRELYFITPRSDKRSTIKPGHPDFTILAGGRVLFIEMKTPAGRLRYEQEQCIAELIAKGFPVVIARNELEAIRATRQFLGEENGTSCSIFSGHQNRSQNTF